MNIETYKGAWRPLFGYVVALSFAGFMLTICYTLIKSPADLMHVAEAIESTSIIWVFALSILGVNVRSRSHDKQIAQGQTPTTIVSALLARDGK